MKIKRVLAGIITVALIITSYSTNSVQAAVPAQPAPEKLAITALNPGTEPPIGYSSSDGGASGYYADIGWKSIPDPSGVTISGKYANIYLEEQGKGYGSKPSTILKEKDVPSGTSPIRMRNLKSGTVYKASAKAYYEYTDPLTNNRIKSDESASSNNVKFLTDINLQAITWSTNQIKIVWDDVWNEGKRIDYKLYVSENKDFANTLPIRITSDLISANGPVVPKEADGRLEYIHNVDDSGRVYYIKIVPELADTEIQKSSETATVIATSYILVKTSKLSTSNAGTIWRLDWSPVVTSMSTSDVKVQYEIDKYVGNVPIPMLIEDSNTTFITVPPDEQVSYYIIRASVTKDGLPYYPEGVNIVSDKIELKEEEIPATPPMPEIVSEFKDSAGQTIISSKDSLGKDTATVLWRAPRKADGSVDKDVLYDIWLTDDPNKIDDTSANILQQSYKPAESTYVIDAADYNKVLGYKYVIKGLEQNHTYYFRIVAKKIFAEQSDGVIKNVEHKSSPALSLIITPPDGAIDQPLIPSNPPLEIKKKPDGTKSVTDTQVTIQLKNRWYEQFNSTTGNWNFIRADKTTLSDIPPYDPGVTLPSISSGYRKVEYDAGVTLSVGCEEYYEGININTINNYKLEKVSTAANDPTEDTSLNAPKYVADATNKHNVIFSINSLKPNTTYILWVRAVRNGEKTLISEPSNPIIFTTLPTEEQVVEKPIVPSFNYNYVGDNYVDLGWGYVKGNTYYLKYATADDPSKPLKTITITSDQLDQLGVNYVRIPGLTPNTQYYFWIQAEAFSKDGKFSKTSEWSDSLPLKTNQSELPPTPRGFGVKNTADAVSKTAITFEWIKEDNMSYVLEVASTIDYSDAKKYTVKDVSVFTAEGLKSNYRYFARLYAVDNTTKLTSLPTNSISVRTLRSSDDYDSDQDIDNVIIGELIDKDATIKNGTWSMRIIGVNADRLVQVIRTDNKLDYTIDASTPPSTASAISITISKKVFDNLDQLKENLLLRTSGISYNLNAGTFRNVVSDESSTKESKYIFTILLTPQKPETGVNELAFKPVLSQLTVTFDNGVNKYEVNQFGVPINVRMPYYDLKDYIEGKTFGYRYDTKSETWQKLDTGATFDIDSGTGIISFRSPLTGLFGVADKTSNLYDDIYGNEYEDAIINVAFNHKLKSVQGRFFEPDSKATVGAAVKLVLDVLDYNYDSDYMGVAQKSGLIKSGLRDRDICTREEAACMAAVMYKIKTAESIESNQSSLKSYKDYSSFDTAIASKVAFSAENGFVPISSTGYFYPKQEVSRGELMYILDKALAMAGDVE